jgi:hypothetical protein
MTTDSEEETMQRIIAAIATVLLATAASAGHVYHGIAEGDPNLYGYGYDDDRVTAVQPGVGDRADIYGGFGVANDDLFPPRNRGVAEVRDPDRRLPEIYNDFGEAPDLSW